MGRYKNSEYSKLQKWQKITSIEDLDVNIYEHDVTPKTITFHRTFTSVQLDWQTIVYQCPMDIEDKMAICDHCWAVSAEDQCSSKCEIGCTIIVLSHNILNCPCLAWRKDYVCKAPFKRYLDFYNTHSKQ